MALVDVWENTVHPVGVAPPRCAAPPQTKHPVCLPYILQPILLRSAAVHIARE